MEMSPGTAIARSCRLADMTAMPTKTAAIARRRPEYSRARGSISCKHKKAMMPPTAVGGEEHRRKDEDHVGV